MNVEVRDSVGKSLGLQEVRNENSRDEYVVSTDFEREESGDAQKYHSRKFK